MKLIIKTKMVKLAIVGSREFNDYEILKNNINNLDLEIECIISGGSKGADTLGEKYADEMNIPKIIYKPDWNKHGRIAGLIRNNDIINNCDYVIAFWNGISSGTLDSINKAKHLNKKLLIVKF